MTGFGGCYREAIGQDTILIYFSSLNRRIWGLRGESPGFDESSRSRTVGQGRLNKGAVKSRLVHVMRLIF